jgi:hypothetical protein
MFSGASSSNRSTLRDLSAERFARDFDRQYGWTRGHANVGYSTDCVKQRVAQSTAGSESKHENVTVVRLDVHKESIAIAVAEPERGGHDLRSGRTPALASLHLYPSLDRGP